MAEPEVVVGREDDDLAPALHPHPGRLRAVEIVEPLVDAVVDELLQLGLDPLFERVGHAADLQDHLARLAVLDDLDGVADALQRKAMGDDRPGVELAGAKEAPHLVPGLDTSSGRSHRRG